MKLNNIKINSAEQVETEWFDHVETELFNQVKTEWFVSMCGLK